MPAAKAWHHAFTIAAAICFTLFISVMVLWLRSYWIGDELGLALPNSGYFFQSSRGAIYLMPVSGRISTGVGLTYNRSQPAIIESSFGRQPKRWQGIDSFTVMVFIAGPIRIWVLADWLPALLLAIPPAIWLRRRLRIHHTAAGFPVRSMGVSPMYPHPHGRDGHAT